MTHLYASFIIIAYVRFFSSSYFFAQYETEGGEDTNRQTKIDRMIEKEKADDRASWLDQYKKANISFRPNIYGLTIGHQFVYCGYFKDEFLQQ